jgi:hypothetical protein
MVVEVVGGMVMVAKVRGRFEWVSIVGFALC